MKSRLRTSHNENTMADPSTLALPLGRPVPSQPFTPSHPSAQASSSRSHPADNELETVTGNGERETTTSRLAAVRRRSTLAPQARTTSPEQLHRMATLSRIRSTHHTASSASEDPELPGEPRPPSPPQPRANAPPPMEEVTATRLLAHYSGLVLASMVGCLIRLGLTALGTCALFLFLLDRSSRYIKTGCLGRKIALIPCR